MTRNPWNLEHTPGGSSGGAAAALAAGIGSVAHGTDGGGSVRIPASYCGLVGLKPTFGRVPHYPYRSPYSSLSANGPVTRKVEDAALLLGVLAQPDRRDPHAIPLDSRLSHCHAASPKTDCPLAYSSSGHDSTKQRCYAPAMRSKVHSTFPNRIPDCSPGSPNWTSAGKFTPAASQQIGKRTFVAQELHLRFKPHAAGKPT